MAKFRFIAGAVCPQCQDTDSLRLRLNEAQQEIVECVCCSYQAQRPENPAQPHAADEQLIGLFKPIT